MLKASSLGGGSEKLSDSSLSVVAPLLNRFGFTPQLSFTYDSSVSNGLFRPTISFLTATTVAFVIVIQKITELGGHVPFVATRDATPAPKP